MISIRSSADMAVALRSNIDAELKRLLPLRHSQLTEGNDLDVSELAQFIIAEPGDTLAEIEEGTGVQLNAKHDGDDFTPPFEFVERHEGWFEAVVILSDDGFGVAIFVPDQLGTDQALLALVRKHA